VVLWGKKRGVYLQPLNGEAAMQEWEAEFIKWLLGKVLKRKFKEFSKMFGSLEMIFTFAAAKTKRVHRT
jgi:hypothetical protein